MADQTLLITGAEVYGAGVADLRIRGGRIAELGRLTAEPGERLIDAAGAALLPGLNDHHIHLLAAAAARHSVRCGPPAVTSAEQLAEVLARGAAAARGGWLRGVGYHESVAGELDRRWLDACVAEVPVRIQHRSGRLWIVNSAGLAEIAARAPEGELAAAVRVGDGRLYDLDRELRDALGAVLPPVAEVSAELAACGVTGLTDMTPQNDTDAARVLTGLSRSRQLRQRLMVAGRPGLEVPDVAGVSLGPTKVHLHEARLPAFEAYCEDIRASHVAGRSVAVHCVTEVELVFALAGFRECGARSGDRIEHAAVTPPALLDDLAELGLQVVTQPHFIRERGAAYRRDVPEVEQPWLYRGRGFLDAGVPLAAGSDAPFGSADPWQAMRAAITRTTTDGAVLGASEALNPEQALGLFLGPLDQPPAPRRIGAGAAADLVLLDRPWQAARQLLKRTMVRLTLAAGEVIYDRNAPPGTDPTC